MGHMLSIRFITTYTLILLLFIMLSGCIGRRADYGCNFRVTGKVYDRATNKPLEGALVIFVDTNLGEHNDKEPVAFGLTQTDSTGTVKRVIDYRWGRKESLFRWWKTSRARQTYGYFDLEICKEGYRKEKRRFDYRLLQQEDDVRVVNLGQIILEIF